MSGYYDMTAIAQFPEHSVVPYLLIMGPSERVLFLDKMTTASISILGDEYNRHNLNTYPGGYFDRMICANFLLYFEALEIKFLLPLRNKYSRNMLNLDLPDVQDAYEKLSREQAEFAIEKIRMILVEGKNYKYRLLESQKYLLGKVVTAWGNENNLYMAKCYMTVIIEMTKTIYGELCATAIRETRDVIISPEKTIQAVEMCRDAIAPEINTHAKKHQTALLQTLAIGWIKTQSPDEILEQMKPKVAVKAPAKKTKKK